MAIKNIINNAGYGTLESTVIERGNGPAKYYRLPGSIGTFGFITPLSQHFCPNCNRIRLTADGKLKPCLLANHEIDIRTALRNGGRDQEIYELFLQAVHGKPIRHILGDTKDGVGLVRGMFQIGG